MHTHDNDSNKTAEHTEHPYLVRLFAMNVPISDRLLADLMSDYWHEENETYSPTRREMLRAELSQRVSNMRVRLGSWIAGIDLSDRELD